MITIYENKKYIDKDKELIEYVDMYFNAILSDIELDNTDKEFMEKIDKATYKGYGRMETPFGTAFLDCLSSGCKTLILLNHLDDSKVINITECGKNVLEIIYAMNNVNVLQTILETPYDYDENKVVTFIDKKGKQQITLREAFNKKWRTQLN